MSFEEFISVNGFRIGNARRGMSCLIRHTTSFWNQEGFDDPAILETDLKALRDAYVHFLEGLKELELYQIELKRFYGGSQETKTSQTEESELGELGDAPPKLPPFLPNIKT